MAISKGSKFIVVLGLLVMIAAVSLGVFVIFSAHLPEGILIIGLGFFVFGTAGLFAVMSKNGSSDSKKRDKSKAKRKDKSGDRDGSSHAKQEYEILLCPVGVKPVSCTLSFGGTGFVVDNGSEMLDIPYSDIKGLRLNTPVLYIDWRDGTTWEMQFKKATAPTVVYQEFLTAKRTSRT